jgi:DNA end-binding protein Ku
MAPRSFWKGYLKLSLVTCPVAMTPAVTQAERVRFHTINAETGNRIRSQYIDSVTGDEVDEEDEVKGYEVGDSKYVMLEEDELDAVALETTHTIEIEKFVPKDDIDTIWLENAHYLVPDGEVGEEAFAVIREAMAETGMVGISRLVLYRRERAVMLEPRDSGIILWSLRQADEVRDPEAYFGEIKDGQSRGDALKLAMSVIEERTVPFEKSMLADRVQQELLDLIEAKQKGKKPPKPKAEKAPPKDNVINIMDALRASIEKEGGTPKAKKKR